MGIRKIVATALLLPAVAVVAQELRKPLAPIAPRSYDQCITLTEQWSAYTWRLHDIYQACVSRNAHRVMQRPCLAEGRAHSEALRASEAARTACYADVKAYLDGQEADRRQQAEQQRAANDAERERQDRLKQLQQEQERMQNAWADQQRQRVEATRRHVEEQQRAAAEAEQRRRDESQRAVNQSMRDLMTARDRAEAYKAKAASTSERHVELTAGELGALDDMRRRAEADGLRPRYVSAEPVTRVAPDGAAVTSAVAGLIGGEAESIIDWGLNRTEVGERFMEAWEMADDWKGKFDALVSTYQYARSAWNGTASYDDHSSAVVSGTSFLAARAFASTPAIAIQVSRVVTGVAGLHQAGLYQIQMLAASDRPLTSAEIAKLSDPRLPIQALFGPFLPLDRMHRMEQVWVEGNRFVDGGGFLTRFGR
jgi:hypothetical protein